MDAVSVPLRGCGFEIIRNPRTNRLVYMFPSPCGDMVLKFNVSAVVDAGLSEFPSPCGDMVLKLSWLITFITWLTSFRPLAGIWF